MLKGVCSIPNNLHRGVFAFILGIKEPELHIQQKDGLFYTFLLKQSGSTSDFMIVLPKATGNNK